MTALASRLRPPKDEPILVGGKPIRARLLQTIIWGLAAAFFAVGIMAGLYFLPLEVHWYIHLGSFYWSGFDLKQGWDSGIGHWFVPGFISTASWPLYRHGWRNLIEPAAATFGVKSLMAKQWRKGKDKRLHPVGLLVRILAVFVIATLLVAGGIWLLNFGIPHISFGGRHFNPETGLFGKYSIGELILGLLVGLVVHQVWAPAGNTIQGFFTDRAAVKIRQRRITDPTYLPRYVRYPLCPPVVRERIAWTVDQRGSIREQGRLEKGVIIPLVIGLFLVGCVGLLAKYGFAHGLHIPYLYPAG